MERIKQEFVSAGARLVFICDKISGLECSKFSALSDKAMARCTRFCADKLLPKCGKEHLYVYKLSLSVRTEGKCSVLTVNASFSDRSARQILRQSSHTFKMRT